MHGYYFMQSKHVKMFIEIEHFFKFLIEIKDTTTNNKIYHHMIQRGIVEDKHSK